VQKIKAVIFDLGRVIVPFDFELGYGELSRLTGFDTAEIRRRIGLTGLVSQFETGLVDSAEFVAGIAGALGIELSVAQFSRIWNSIFLKETLIPEEMLARLKQRYRLLLLSNTNAIHFEGLEQRYPLLRHFHEHVLSFRVQVMKPDAAIYLHAVQLAGVPPAECLFIDDLPENVAGAQAVGMQAVLFTGRAQLERDFERLGVVY
jgi:FMN phosphatase YigB (HAD superfamily)